jgi:isopentenyl-diphosphate Delta-isomerase
MPDEYIDIVDSKGKISEKKELKSIAHKKGLWHQVIHIIVYNSKGHIIIQRRAPDKKTFPNIWDISVGGHIGAGEDPKKTARKELAEELGIHEPLSALDDFGRYHYIDIQPEGLFIEKEYSYTFILKKDVHIKKIKFQKSEVAEVKWTTIDEYEKYLSESPVFKMFPEHMNYYLKILGKLKKKIKK